MKFENVLIEAVQKANEYISLFIVLEEQPERILTDMFSDGSDSFLTRIIESSKELTGEVFEAHDLQDELYRILFPYLASLLKGVELSYEKDLYPAPIHIIQDGEIVALLDIYQKTFLVVPHQDLQREQEHLDTLIAEFNINQVEMERYEGYHNNPTSYGDTAMKKMEIVMRKNHYQKEIQNKYQELFNYSLEVEQNIISQRLRVEKMAEDLRPYEDEQYRLAMPFREKYRYRIARLGEMEDEESENKEEAMEIVNPLN